MLEPGAELLILSVLLDLAHGEILRTVPIRVACPGFDLASMQATLLLLIALLQRQVVLVDQHLGLAALL